MKTFPNHIHSCRLKIPLALMCCAVPLHLVHGVLIDHECTATSPPWFGSDRRRWTAEMQPARDTNGDDPMNGFTIEEIWDFYFDCNTYFEFERPVHNESIWMMLRGVYQGVMGPSRSSILQPLSATNGFYVDYEVKQSEGKGRGVFAKQDITKGEKVYSAKQQMAKFSSGKDYRRFLRAIPQDLSCDVIQWAYVENLKDGNLTICVDLDDGSIINDGGEEEGNVGCDAEHAMMHPDICETDYFALRDIKKGEEILCIYAEFDVPDGWARFGL